MPTLPNNSQRPLGWKEDPEAVVEASHSSFSAGAQTHELLLCEPTLTGWQHGTVTERCLLHSALAWGNQWLMIIIGGTMIVFLLISFFAVIPRTRLPTFYYVADMDPANEGSRCVVEIDTVKVNRESLESPYGIFAVLHKPVGYTCSHDPSEGPLVYDLLPQIWLKRRPAIKSVGRLDKNTSGLLLVTTLSQIIHKLTSPNHQVSKRYHVTLAEPLGLDEREDMVARFESGQLMLNGEVKPCRTAQLMFTNHTNAVVHVTEGRYHQVRRMFAACGARVTKLHRAAVGNLDLADLAVPEGSWAHLPLDTPL